MSKAQNYINRVCEHRGLPPIEVNQPCNVDGNDGVIINGNSSANFNVKFDHGKIFNCHPYFKMTIYSMDKSETIYSGEN